MDAASKYVKCTPAKDHLPSVCDCTKLGVGNCMFKLNITRNPLAVDTDEDSNNVYFINNEKMGPTLIAKIDTYMVVDVFNSMKNNNTSIHWHGIHQYNTAYMDCVAHISQEPIRPSKALRYVFKAWPAGTHWYHSHVKDQRDKGIYGVLIVLPHVQDYPDIIDEPDKNVIAIREGEVIKDNWPDCEPDHSKPPVLFGEITSIRINEYELGTELNSNQFAPLFYVTYKRRYRFRVIGVMFANAFRLSIDGHKLNFIAADGYSTLKKLSIIGCSRRGKIRHRGDSS
ncbi:laccase-2-like [Xenia sp. Carnegie-2017]|uniref:laccase-2-like n=1 Tax=Xenia sp. Carnegie-2017 TaxID=2897299 RepID=UPI001F03D940|nr:laccase-2-like [Xenia sp. Carnegie-2017]